MIELRVQAGLDAAASLARVKMLAWDHPGAHELAVLVCRGDVVARRLVLGPDWRFDGSPECVAALSEFGEVTLHEG